MTGIEYELFLHTADNSIFVISAKNHITPEKIELIAYFCIVNGLIFKSPKLHSVLHSKIHDIAYGLNELFDVIFDDYPLRYKEENNKKYEIDLQDLFNN